MQPIVPADKRQPNVQIAASIRAAILTGELEPASQLPAGHELAKFFGVSRMTVQTAIRTLRDEGFVRSRSGSGVYVRDQASLPAPGETDHPLAGVATFLFEMGHMKHLSRAGWLLLGIRQPETVAEHSFRRGVAGVVGSRAAYRLRASARAGHRDGRPQRVVVCVRRVVHRAQR
jgi:putative hydrolase of HD superfamily